MEQDRMIVAWDAYREALPSMLQAIGRTPLVRLGRTAPEGTDLLAKIEWYGPTGSLKDRIYAHMIDRAEERGDLRPGMTLLECSTGNAGTACAFVAAVKGYPCVVVMPEGMSDERKKLMRAFGAELVLTPGAESDVDLALVRMEEIRAADPARYFVPAQFDNPDNPEAHALTTAPEVWEQTGGRLDAVVASQGTGGWITAVGRALKDRKPDLKVYAVEPAECPIISARRWGSHGIEGIGDGFVPRNLDLAVLDGVVTTTTEESLERARRLAREEGVFCGVSGGCNVAASLKVAAAHPELRRIVTVIPDTGQRYFTTALFGEEEHADIPEREHELDPRSVEELDRHAARLEVIG
jgi:cysteine synthase A